ncbi:MAG: NAD(P)/FAD-dependent oxidoreductase [candidate division WOR-3 bacterium]|nr:MAG: NAD(P)/FAD-dependent oxidoreductase [candidate division WOR-3 bacterium]
MKKPYDLVVVGGGPVGSYTAYLLADKGFSVCLFDEKSEIGKNVICAGVLGKEAFKRYDLPSESIVSRIDSVSFISPYGQRLEYKPKDVLAYVVDREVFDKGLITLAQKCGVDVYLKQRVTSIRESSKQYIVVSRNKRFRSKAVVLATGVDYALHKRVGIGRTQSFLYGSQIEMPLSFAPSRIEIHIGKTFAPGSFGWVIPAGKNASKVGVIVRRRGKKWLQRMLEKRLRFSVSKLNSDELKVKPIAYGPSKRSVKGNILAVGEAAGQVKTTTGGGIFYGLLCSEIAVDKLSKTLKNGASLRDYELAWRSALISELDIGKHLRKFASQLSDGDIERLFNFVKKNRFWVQLLVPRINFDFHSNLIFFCMKSFGSLLGFPEEQSP